MHEAMKTITHLQMERTAAALRKNRMQATCVQSVAEVAPLIQSLLPAGATVAAGGSMTLGETGVAALLANGDYNFLNRDNAQTPEEKDDIMRAAFSADYYFASANAITEQGEIYEVDGHANRIAALAFGPKNVILVAGYNKIVADLAAAKLRVETVAAPANTQRFGCKTPCVVTGKCTHCKSEARICCSTLILGQQRQEGRIHVILVPERLGF